MNWLAEPARKMRRISSAHGGRPTSAAGGEEGVGAAAASVPFATPAVEDHDGDTYRAVYTVRMAGNVYVLHVFQKKSKKGIQTPKHVMDLVRVRLHAAERDHRERSKGR